MSLLKYQHDRFILSEQTRQTFRFVIAISSLLLPVINQPEERWRINPSGNSKYLKEGEGGGEGLISCHNFFYDDPPQFSGCVFDSL